MLTVESEHVIEAAPKDCHSYNAFFIRTVIETVTSNTGFTVLHAGILFGTFHVHAVFPLLVLVHAGVLFGIMGYIRGGDVRT